MRPEGCPRRPHEGQAVTIRVADMTLAIELDDGETAW